MNPTTEPDPMAAGPGPRRAGKPARAPLMLRAAERLPKPDWIRTRAAPPSGRFQQILSLLRADGLTTLCEQAGCPNIGECFGDGGATFMIMGRLCTRHCPVCAVAHGRPDAPDPAEPGRLAATVAALGLRHVVITSVNRDDLRDGGAAHFAQCVAQLRALAPGTRVELLAPDFRGRVGHALAALAAAPPDVMNHHIETVPRLYPLVRPGAGYAHALAVLRRFKARYPDVLTKSGIMLGLGETDDEVLEVLRALRANQVDMVTIGQYLAPSAGHLPVQRYVAPATFDWLRRRALAMGFVHVAAGPLVRPCLRADQQALAAGLDGEGAFAGEIRRRQPAPRVWVEGDDIC